MRFLKKSANIVSEEHLKKKQRGENRMKIGFIGCGSMGGAMLEGILQSRLSSNDIWIYEDSLKRREELIDNYKINIALDMKEMTEECKIIFLAIKPHICYSVLEEIKEKLDGKILVSVAAGVTIDAIEDIIGDDKKVIRIMPNTPACVGEAMTSLTPNRNIEEDEKKEVAYLLEGFGKVEEVEERMIHAVIGASGSAPAYVFMFIEAMADAAVLKGMPRDKAYKFASQAVLGSAKMVLETGVHPGQLKDMVCSPGGTTIEAVTELEKRGMKAAVMGAMIKCMEKSEEMSKK